MQHNLDMWHMITKLVSVLDDVYFTWNKDFNFYLEFWDERIPKLVNSYVVANKSMSRNLDPGL